MTAKAAGEGTKAKPWKLKTPSRSSEYEIGPRTSGRGRGSAGDRLLGRSPKNPVKGWYGLKKGLRGRFGMYMPPLLEALGLAEVEHNPKNNRMHAI